MGIMNTTSCRVHPYARMRILALSAQNASKASIKRILQREGFVYSYNTVMKICNRFKQHHRIYSLPISGRPKKYSQLVGKRIDQLLERNNELTAPKLQKRLKIELGENVPLSTIKRIRYNLGWRNGAAKYCQFIRPKNATKRVKFAESALANQWDFKDVLFTDECTVILDRHAKRCFRRVTDAFITLKPKVKHPLQVHIWAGISWHGASRICIFDGHVRMDRFLFCKILSNNFLPFSADMEARVGIKPVLQMDNDPKHTSRYAKKWLGKHKVEVMTWPAESPDLNPIELVWHQLKTYIREKKPSSKDELIETIKKFWNKHMDLDQCRRYVAHIHKVLPAVILAKGGPTGM